MQVLTYTSEETKAVAARFASTLGATEVLGLVGPLGAGKTCFVQGLAEGLEIPYPIVNSPSFTIVQEYLGGRLNLFHIDFYRLQRESEVWDLGLEEYYERGACVVEWADRFPSAMPSGTRWIYFEIVGENKRRIKMG